MLNPKLEPTDSVNTSIYSTNIVHAPGAIIERYQIIQQLGEGKASKAYLAKDLGIGGDSRCIIEHLLSLDSLQEGDKARLAKKLEIVQRLSDRPQVPQYWTYFINDGQIYLVREYIDGEELIQKVKRRLFDEAQVIHLLQDILKTLDLIHKNNLIHQAIEPAHLIERQETNSYTLLSFDALKIKRSWKNLGSLSQIGTYGYLAPEQQVGKPRFSSDIYGLGKTAVYALTGLSPQELEQTSLVWQRYCSDKLAAIIDRMTAAKCSERYHTALEVLYDLKPLSIVGQVIDGRYRIIQHLQEKAAVNSYLAENLRRSYQSPCIVERVEFGECDRASWQKIEQRLAKQLSTMEKLVDCPQIPQLLDHFQERDEFYLVKTYIHGESLSQILAKQRFSEAEVVRFLESALTALAFVHEQGLIHRYIQPENLLIANSDRVVLTGLGILEDIQSMCGENLAERRSDNSRYFAPEQISGRPTLSSDIYALGIIAIEALTGTKPERLTIQTEKIVWQEELVGNRLAKIINKMTALDVSYRYQLVENVIRDLRKVEVKSSRVTNTTNRSNLTDFTSKWKFQPTPIIIAILGIVSLLGSIEFAFPALRPTYYWYRGKQLLSEQPQVALNAFSRAIELQPNSYLARSGKGDALYRLKRFQEAIAAYDEAGELNSRDPQNWKKRGDAFYRLERFPKALAAYNRALELEPNDRVILNSKGKTLENLQRYEEALLFYEAALKGDLLNAEFLSDRARVLISLGRYYDALTVLNRVRAIEPNSPQLWQEKVFALQALGRPNEAATTYREVVSTYQTLLEKTPDNYSLWLAQGDFLTQLRMTQTQALFSSTSSNKAYSSPLHIQSKAIAAYEEAIAISPKSYLAWIGKAKTLLASSEYQAALTALDRALEIRPQADRPWQIRGSILKDGLNQPEAAVAAYDRAIAVNPDFASHWRDRGLALSQANQYSLAIASFTKANKLNPKDSKTWVGLANALQGIDRQQEAISAIDRALAIEPQNSLLWQTKGSILTQQQNYNAACDTYRESRQFAPDFAPITQAMNIIGCRMDGND